MFLTNNINTWNNYVIDTYTEFQLEKYSEEYKENLRYDVMQIVRGCEWSDNTCFVQKIFNNISKIEYRLTPNGNNYLQTPSYTYKIMAGDCKSVSMLFCSLMYHAGKECEIKCDPTHCWNEIITETELITVDMTGPFWIKENKNEKITM
jgi:hypothetical protein